MAAGNWAGLALAGLAITGCGAGPTFESDPWEGRAAAPVRTVSLAGGARSIVLGAGHAEVPASAFSEAVLGLLAERGFARTEAGTADLWLRAHLRLRRSGGRQAGRGASPPPAAGAPGGPGASSDVEIVLELVRRATGERVWTGSAAATLAQPFWSPEGRRALVGLAARLLAPVHGAAG